MLNPKDRAPKGEEISFTCILQARSRERSPKVWTSHKILRTGPAQPRTARSQSSQVPGFFLAPGGRAVPREANRPRRACVRPPRPTAGSWLALPGAPSRTQPPRPASGAVRVARFPARDLPRDPQRRRRQRSAREEAGPEARGAEKGREWARPASQKEWSCFRPETPGLGGRWCAGANYTSQEAPRPRFLISSAGDFAKLPGGARRWDSPGGSLRVCLLACTHSSIRPTIRLPIPSSNIY